MSPNTPCPSVEILRRSLDPDDPMPEPERQRIEVHVDQCNQGCKAAIETLLRSNTLAADAETIPPGERPGDPALERPTPSLPGYEVLGELGRGGMGVVYKARHLGLNRVVALKMILAGAHAGADDLARFRREAEAVAALRHPHVVQIYEIGEHDGRPYFSLEYVEGGTLAQKLAGEPQPPRLAAERIETLARAVHFAHQQGVIHRDLKPANVLLTAEGEPKIADFGLAKRLHGDGSQTRTGEIVGTPNYMAPEQAAPGTAPIGTPADVYALGAILYEMLTGRPPFLARTPLDVLMRVVSDDPTPPRRLRPRTPADLETICLKCLRKEPGRRYGSAEALADDLRRFLTGRPIQARRVGVMERTVKWVRRNAVLTALLVVVFLASAGGAGGWLWAARDRAAVDRAAAARRSRAEGAASAALARAEEEAEQAAAVERAADDRGGEEPETPEAAKRVVELRRQATAAVDEAEQGLAEVLGTAAAQARTAEQRQGADAKLHQAEKLAGLLNDLDRARAALLGGHQGGGFDADSAARSYAAALSAYGLDISMSEAETAAEIRQARPGVRLALVLALDDWASCIRGLDASEAQRLSRIAGGADDDVWRRRYRAALGDVSALKRLAQEALGLHLPAVSQVQLARDLQTRGAHFEAAALLRTARRQHPTDFWGYFDLANYLFDPNHPDPATRDEAESCACTAVALRPDSAAAHGTLGDALRAQGDRAGAAECYKKAIELDPRLAMAHNNLGDLLYDEGDLDGAAAAFKKAIELDPKLAYPHCGLGNVLFDQGDPTASAAAFKKAIELDPTYATAHNNLGKVLHAQGDLPGAAACYQKAIQFDPTYILAHCGLGDLLAEQGDADGAAACYKRAIDLDPKYADAHCGLGNVLYDKRDMAGAAVSYRKAIELDPKYADAQYGLGNVLGDQGDLEGAAACYKKAIELDPKYAEAHHKLGLLLREQGKFAEARTNFRRCLDLLGANDPLRAETADQLQQCERLLALEPKLGPVLKGEQQPADDDERLGLAEICESQRRYAAAARFSRDAFTHDPKLADDLPSGNRYAAALDAARAGCGQGEDAKDLDDQARAGWRKQALAWLRADLRLWSKQPDGGKPEDRKAAGETLRRWQQDVALAGLRDAAELAKLPADEQEAWRKLWKDVQSILDKVSAKKESPGK